MKWGWVCYRCIVVSLQHLVFAREKTQFILFDKFRNLEIFEFVCKGLGSRDLDLFI